MNFDDANRLATHYKNTWRGGPTIEVLREHFAEMEPQRLEPALTQLALKCDYPPTIAHLWREYETTRPPPDYTRPKPDYSDAVAPPWQRTNITRDQWLAAQKQH